MLEITSIQVSGFKIPRSPSLDPITVLLQDYSPAAGEIVITCYGQVWQAYFGAMGDRTLEKFLIGCDVDYIANRMQAPDLTSRVAKQQAAYLHRIVTVVLDAMRQRQEESHG